MGILFTGFLVYDLFIWRDAPAATPPWKDDRTSPVCEASVEENFKLPRVCPSELVLGYPEPGFVESASFKISGD